MSPLSADALQQTTLELEHQSGRYTINRIGTQQWKVTDAKGRNLGTLEIRADNGEGGDPVFMVFRPVSDAAYMEGSDWESLVRALINDVEAD